MNLIGFLVAFGKFYQFLNFHVSYLKWKMTRTQVLALKHLAHAIYCAFWRCENPFLIFLIFQLNTYKHFVKKRYVFFSWNWIVSALLQKLSSWASTIELLLYCSCKTFYFPLLILCQELWLHFGVKILIESWISLWMLKCALPMNRNSISGKDLKHNVPWEIKRTNSLFVTFTPYLEFPKAYPWMEDIVDI